MKIYRLLFLVFILIFEPELNCHGSSPKEINKKDLTTEVKGENIRIEIGQLNYQGEGYPNDTISVIIVDVNNTKWSKKIIANFRRDGKIYSVNFQIHDFYDFENWLKNEKRNIFQVNFSNKEGNFRSDIFFIKEEDICNSFIKYHYEDFRSFLKTFPTDSLLNIEIGRFGGYNLFLQLYDKCEEKDKNLIRDNYGKKVVFPDNVSVDTISNKNAEDFFKERFDSLNVKISDSIRNGISKIPKYQPTVFHEDSIIKEVSKNISFFGLKTYLGAGVEFLDFNELPADRSFTPIFYFEKRNIDLLKSGDFCSSGYLSLLGYNGLKGKLDFSLNVLKTFNVGIYYEGLMKSNISNTRLTYGNLGFSASFLLPVPIPKTKSKLAIEFGVGDAKKNTFFEYKLMGLLRAGYVNPSVALKFFSQFTISKRTYTPLIFFNYSYFFDKNIENINPDDLNNYFIHYSAQISILLNIE